MSASSRATAQASARPPMCHRQECQMLGNLRTYTRHANESSQRWLCQDFFVRATASPGTAMATPGTVPFPGLLGRQCRGRVPLLSGPATGLRALGGALVPIGVKVRQAKGSQADQGFPLLRGQVWRNFDTWVGVGGAALSLLARRIPRGLSTRPNVFRGRRNHRPAAPGTDARLARVFRPGALAGRAGLRRGGTSSCPRRPGRAGRAPLAVPIDDHENRGQLDRAQGRVIDRLAEVNDLCAPVITALRLNVLSSALRSTRSPPSGVFC